jgi:hypothetical protein
MIVAPALTRAAEEIISDLAETLEIPEQRYEAADRSYKSVSEWLERPESRFASVHLNVYTQGSFRLGTAIRPLSGEEPYDMDVVCEFSLSKAAVTQQKLHEDLGAELERYATRHRMKAPEPWRRCWTLNYSDDAQFHMDLLPSVPDGPRQRALLEALSLQTRHIDKAVSITDSQHPNYRHRSDLWPVSNPNGYAEWFYERMKPAFESRRRAMMLAEAKADVSEIPEFRVKTPLQSAIQILKRHRDVRFSDQPEQRPTSIVITTLAAHAYQQEATITGALFSILHDMDKFIERHGEEYRIVNPSDPRENFADFWKDEPQRKDAFFEWLETARADFRHAAQQANAAEIVEILAPRMGRALVEAAAAKRHRPIVEQASLGRRVSNTLRRILDAPHRKPMAWPTVRVGNVQIASATELRNGFRAVPFLNDGPPVMKGSKLRFVAQTDVPKPYKVFWQVVNTGQAATAARQLRGGFEEMSVEAGHLTKEETAKYGGSHSVECFIVKDGYCAARSGPFVVNIS